MTSMTRKPVLALLATGSLLLTTACGTGTAGEDTDGDDTISIVASTAIWADVAEAVVDSERVEVQAVVEGNDADPHSFEPAAADMARAAEADIIVVGGGGYDAWLYDSQDESKIIHALPLTAHDHSHDEEGAHDHGEEDHSHDHDHSEEGEHDHGAEGLSGLESNEHIWYDTSAVTQVAEDIADRVAELDPEGTADTAAFTEDLAGLHERIHDLPAVRVAQTEPIADYILSHSDISEITPEGYRASSLSHSEPTAADLAQFLELIEAGDLDLLVYNPQTSTDLTDRIRTAATDAGIPVVEIFETPQQGENYLDFFHGAVDRLEAAANETDTGSAGDAAAAGAETSVEQAG